MFGSENSNRQYIAIIILYYYIGIQSRMIIIVILACYKINVIADQFFKYLQLYV